jgi:ACS family tartrate transporter-like MFS transporter
MGDDRVFAKCAWRLLPLMMLLYLINYIDRVNVGFAALTMNKDLAFTPAIYGLGAGIFFFSYSLSQVPANLIFDRLGARRWIFTILLVWGAISAANALVRSPSSFYLLRFLLGVAEAGFFPGMIFYITLWFPQSYRARFIALFYTAVPLAFVIGGPLSSVILPMEGIAGLHGWQWLFVIEGLPACFFAFVVWKMLPDGPSDASWLSQDEKTFIATRLATEERAEHSDPWLALRDPRVVALGVAGFGIGVGEYGVQLWLPQIVHAMGFSNAQTGFVIAVPYAISVIALVVWGRLSDRAQERFWFAALPLFLAAAGLTTAALTESHALGLVAITAAVIGIIGVVGPFWTLPSSFLSGSAAAASIGLVRTIGSFGGFVGPVVVGLLRESTGDFAAPIAALGLSLLLAGLILLGLGHVIAARAIPREARI